MSIQTAPRGFVQKLLPLLTPPTLKEIEAARDEVLAGHSRLQRTTTPGPEGVIESLYRCRITHWLQTEYGLNVRDVPQCLNSSHLVPRGVCIDRGRHDHWEICDAEWAKAWKNFRNRYSQWVDTPLPNKENPGKADLFFAVSGRIVSIEFKYAAGVPGRECIEQTRRYLTHAATILAVYGLAPVSRKFETAIRVIRREIASERAYVVPVIGPAVQLRIR